MVSEATLPQTAAAPKTIKKRKVPEYLVHETIDGVPFYYARFRDVLNKKKTFDEIMAGSGLQSIIKAYLMILFAKKLDLDKFQPVCGEVGNHLDHRSNLALDVAVYENRLLTPDKINEKFIDVNPKIVIEIDVKVKMDDPLADIFSQFVLKKVQKLLSFGTERIVWVFTKDNTVIVAKPGNSWEVFKLDQDVMLLEGISMNIGEYLASKGVLLP